MDWGRERRIRSVLRKLAGQRVATIFQPGNVLVIEKAIQRSEEVNADLFTAYLRGWVEPFPEAIPSENITEEGLPPDWRGFTQAQVVYRLTEGGWGVIRRSHSWVLATFWVALLTLIVTIGAAYWTILNK